jgi:hypothetical protein
MVVESSSSAGRGISSSTDSLSTTDKISLSLSSSDIYKKEN